MLNLIKKLLTIGPKPVSETKPESSPKQTVPSFSPLAAQTEIRLRVHEAEDLRKSASAERKGLLAFKEELNVLEKQVASDTEELYCLRSKHADGDDKAKAFAVKVLRNLERTKRTLALKASAVEATERLIVSLEQAIVDKEDLVTELEQRLADYSYRELMLEKEAQRAELLGKLVISGSSSGTLEELEREQKLREMNMEADAIPEAVSLADIDPFAGLEERDHEDPKNP